jgi:hypothetical protein
MRSCGTTLLTWQPRGHGEQAASVVLQPRSMAIGTIGAPQALILKIVESAGAHPIEGAAVQRWRGLLHLVSLLRVGGGVASWGAHQQAARNTSALPVPFGFFILSQSGERDALAGRLALAAPMSRSARVLARSAAQSATSHVARPCDPQTLQVAGRAEPRQTCGSPPPTSTMWI